jgi:hypothetical protein
MEVPDRIKVPDIIAHLPPLPVKKVFTKWIERVSLEAHSLLTRATTLEKKHQLTAFNAKWEQIKKDVLAGRLAAFDTVQEYQFAIPQPLKAFRRHFLRHPDKSPIKSLGLRQDSVLAVVEKLQDKAHAQSVHDALDRSLHLGHVVGTLSHLSKKKYLIRATEVSDSWKIGPPRPRLHYRITDLGRAALYAEGFYESRLQYYRAELNLPQIPAPSPWFDF